MIAESPIQSFDGGWLVQRVCPKCNRFVKVDDTIFVNEYGMKDAPNATCKKCGRVEAPLLEGGSCFWED